MPKSNTLHNPRLCPDDWNTIFHGKFMNWDQRIINLDTAQTSQLSPRSVWYFPYGGVCWLGTNKCLLHLKRTRLSWTESISRLSYLATYSIKTSWWCFSLHQLMHALTTFHFCPEVLILMYQFNGLLWSFKYPGWFYIVFDCSVTSQWLMIKRRYNFL